MNENVDIEYKYGERNVEIIITTNHSIDLTSRYFHLDIFDSVRSSFAYDLQQSKANPDVFKRISARFNNIDTYICNDEETRDEHLNENYIQLWVDGENDNILHVRLHDMVDTDDGSNSFKGIASAVVSLTIPIDDTEGTADHIHTQVSLFPKLLKSDIELYDESTASKDVQLSGDERRPGYMWNEDAGFDYSDDMFVNTSAGIDREGRIGLDKYGEAKIDNSHEISASKSPVPLYCVRTSAYMPERIYYPSISAQNTIYDYGIGFDLENTSSYLYNAEYLFKQCDIPYEIEGPLDYTFTDDAGSTKCKQWIFTQFITTSAQNKYMKNQLLLDIPVSGSSILYPD